MNSNSTGPLTGLNVVQTGNLQWSTFDHQLHGDKVDYLFELICHDAHLCREGERFSLINGALEFSSWKKTIEGLITK